MRLQRRSVFLSFLLFGYSAMVGAAEQFDVQEIRVLGNSQLPATVIETAVYPYTGPEKTIADVESARLALETAYRLAGFSTVYVDIPEQTVDDGIVRLKVTEGRLSHVRIEGAKYFSARRIRSAFPDIDPGDVPNIPALQRGLASLNSETGDRSVVPVLSAGAQPGTVDLTLRVEDELPLRASVEVNDQYTANTTRWRLGLSLGYDNLFNRFDSVSFQYQTAPEEPSEMAVIAGSYVTRWGRDDRNRFAFTYIDSDSDVAAVGTLSVLGKGQIAQAQLIFPLVNEATASHTLTFGAAFKSFDELIRLDVDENLATPISYMSFSLGHGSVWRGERAEWKLNSGIDFGLRRIFNGAQEFADKRYRGRPNFFTLHADGSYGRPFGKWLAMRTRVGGQYSAEPLISNEQFAIGGAHTVRGYLEASELGDVGALGSFEFGSQPRPVFGDRFMVEGFAFYDAGIVAVLKPLPGEARRSDLASAGLAFNLGLDDHFAASVSWAYPLVPSGTIGAGDSRFLFLMRSSW
jgi:hemolysin activation/secretion protein